MPQPHEEIKLTRKDLEDLDKGIFALQQAQQALNILAEANLPDDDMSVTAQHCAQALNTFRRRLGDKARD